MTSRPESGQDVVDAVEQPAVEPVADERLLVAHDLARAALLEITPDATVGEPVGHTVEADGVVSLRFANRLAGYPGWFWTVTLARVDDAEPTVLEIELLPGEQALLAPEWIPWAVRLADYHAQQQATAEAVEQLGDDIELDEDEDPDEDLIDDELDDVDDLDAVDFDSDGSVILHAGDVDGVDIDELDEDRDDLDLDDDDFVSDEDDLGADELQDGEDDDHDASDADDAADDRG